MTKHTEQIEAEILELPVNQRAALAQRLLASLDDIDDQENDRLWLDEAQRRLVAYRSNSLTARDAYVALDEIRKLV